jgi:hypothetical protein
MFWEYQKNHYLVYPLTYMDLRLFKSILQMKSAMILYPYEPWLWITKWFHQMGYASECEVARNAQRHRQLSVTVGSDEQQTFKQINQRKHQANSILLTNCSQYLWNMRQHYFVSTLFTFCPPVPPWKFHFHILQDLCRLHRVIYRGDKHLHSQNWYVRSTVKRWAPNRCTPLSFKTICKRPENL